MLQHLQNIADEVRQGNQEIAELIRETNQTSARILDTLKTMEWMQSRAQPSPQDALRHAEQYFGGEEWRTTQPVLSQITRHASRGTFTGQGYWPVRADRWRGQAVACRRWLQARRLHPPAQDGQWWQGHVLPWLPSVQAAMAEEGVPDQNLVHYRDPEFTQLLGQAPSVGPDGEEMSQGDVQEAELRMHPYVLRRGQAPQ